MNIKQRRMKSGIRQEDLALLLGLDRSTVAKWETGVSYPRAELLPKIAETLNCKVDDLFDSDHL